MEAQQWRLSYFLIEEEGGQLYWQTWIANPEDPDWSCISGRAYVKDCNVLLLSCWKNRYASREGNWDEVNKLLDSLPQWDKTAYFLKLTDFDMSPLTNCSTLEPALPEIESVIVPKVLAG